MDILLPSQLSPPAESSVSIKSWSKSNIVRLFSLFFIFKWLFLLPVFIVHCSINVILYSVALTLITLYLVRSICYGCHIASSCEVLQYFLRLSRQQNNVKTFQFTPVTRQCGEHVQTIATQTTVQLMGCLQIWITARMSDCLSLYLINWQHFESSAMTLWHCILRKCGGIG